MIAVTGLTGHLAPGVFHTYSGDLNRLIGCPTTAPRQAVAAVLRD